MTDTTSILNTVSSTFPDGARILLVTARFLPRSTSDYKRRRMWETIAGEESPRGTLTNEDAEAAIAFLTAAIEAGDSDASKDVAVIRAYLAPLKSWGDTDGDQTRADISKASLANSDLDYRLSNRHYGRR